MCGIVGLFLKDKSLEPQLGALLTDMLVTMTDRGPDSAGIAIYSEDREGFAKLTVQMNDPAGFEGLGDEMSKALGTDVSVEVKDTHAVIELAEDKLDEARTALAELCPEARIMSQGEVIEIYKEVGLPAGHTRMATESAVTTLGAHPFSTGADQCLVHNGSLSNHNSLRRKLAREGVKVNTLNDTEVAAAYLTWKMQQGKSLGDALEASLEDLDGFFNFVVGTKDGFGVVRDPISCKPAVMAETDQYVAFGSEYRALVNLPGIEDARVWEPEPATVYFWKH